MRGISVPFPWPIQENALDENRPLRIEQYPVNPMSPYEPLHIGLFKDTVRIGEEEREYWFYLPQNRETSSRTILIFSGNKDVIELLEEGYQTALENNGCVGVFLNISGEWDYTHIERELKWCWDCYLSITDGEFFVSSGLSVIGEDGGTEMAVLFAILHNDTVASFAVLDECNLSPENLQFVGNLPSDKQPDRKKEQAVISAWIFGKNAAENELLMYLKRNYKDEEFEDQYSQIWKPDNKKRWKLNDPGQAELRYSSIDKYKNWKLQDKLERVIYFLNSYRKIGGIEDGYIAKKVKTEDMGLVECHENIGGVLRKWYLYIPETVKKYPEEQYPVVVAVHGFSGSGITYAEDTGWIHTAEERGFILVLPCAYPIYRKDPDRRLKRVLPTPVWNTIPGGEKNSIDDIQYIERVLSYVEERCPVDRTRIYATGHSNGARMVQTWMRYLPKKFAAFATIGSMEGIVAVPQEMNDSVIRPCWFLMGEYDLGDADRLEKGNSNDLTIKNVCRTDHVDYDNRQKYCCGRYKHYVMYNNEKIPLVRFTGIEKMYHSVLPEMNELIYDEFFCKFQRLANGQICYQG